MAKRRGVHDPANAAKVVAGGRKGACKGGRKAGAERLGVHDPANAAKVAAGRRKGALKGLAKGRKAGGLAPKPGCTNRRKWRKGGALRQAARAGRQARSCFSANAWGAHGKVHNLIMGQESFMKGGLQAVRALYRARPRARLIMRVKREFVEGREGGGRGGGGERR